MRTGRVGNIPSLDGIRAVAALIVFTSHAFSSLQVPSSLGVTIFFFLSGYLITTLLRNEFATEGSINLKHFYIRRACRIFPPMYFMLLSMIALTVAARGTSVLDGSALAAQFAHLTNYYIVLSGSDHDLLPYTSVMWSLAVEEHFYLLFPPLLAFLLWRLPPKRIALALCAVCAAALLWRVALVYFFDVSDAHIFYATDARFDSLLFGCVMAICCNPVLDHGSGRSDHSSPSWREKTILAISLALLAISLLYRDPGFQKTMRYTMQGIALFPIFWLAVRYPKWPLFSWLNWAPVRRFGVITYSFYLAHPFWIEVAHHFASGVAAAALAFGMTTLFSVLLYQKVERPFLRLGATVRSGTWNFRFKERT